MASGKELKAIITLVGKIDPSLAKSVEGVEKKLKGLSKIGGVAQGAAKVAKAAAASLAVVGGAAASAATAVGAAALQGYSQYEQLVGGIETLYGESSSTIARMAAEAYKTAGVSANTYMEQATNFSASLIQSLGGDTQRAAEYADLAIKDMSDNANKMGTDISSIQQTYQSLMRGNYAMLDNLKLGYGGTKSELERLVADAEKLTGQALDPSKFSDVITAIHAVQENLGITGTTALEAATTIEGSVNSAKAAWENWVVGLGRSDADMGALTDQLVESIANVASNVGPVVVRIGSSIVSALPGALSGASAALAPVLSEALAGAWNVAVQALGAVGIPLPSVDASQVMAAAQQVVSTIKPMLDVVGPAISRVVNEAIPPLVSAVSAILPALVSIASVVLPPILNVVSALLPIVIQVANVVGGALVAAAQALSPILGIVLTAISAILPVVEAITGPLSAIVNALLPPLSGLLMSLSGPISTVTGLFNGLVGVVQSIVGWIGSLISRIGEAASALANSPIGQFVGGAMSFLGFATGGFTSGPGIVGEDPRYPTEAVISFNPAYRAQNVRYWQMAGHMLGAFSSASPAASTVSGGGTVIDLSGMTYSPRVEVRGNASRDDIMSALRQSQAEFADFLQEVLAGEAEVSYA